MWSAIGAALAALVIAALKAYFGKSPDQKETEDLSKEKNHEAKLDAAMDKAKSGDPSDLSRLLNK